MISFWRTQHPWTGYNVNPAMLTANGTSLLQGMAALATQKQHWHWALIQEQPSHSGLTPRQPRGKRQGADGLQQHSRLQQQIPAWKGQVCKGEGIDVNRMRNTASPKRKPTNTQRGTPPAHPAKTTSTYLSTASTAITIRIESAVDAQGGTEEDYVFFVNRVVRHGD
jgi:hypothetical protein